MASESSTRSDDSSQTVHVRGYTRMVNGEEVEVAPYDRRKSGGWSHNGEHWTTAGGERLNFSDKPSLLADFNFPPLRRKSLLEPVADRYAAQSPSAEGGKRPYTPEIENFLDMNYAAADKVAQKYGVDVKLLLGLSAHESAWGKSRRVTEENNPFGATPNDSIGITYRSIEHAWQRWGEDWGKRVQGVGSDAEEFTRRLIIDNQPLSTDPNKNGVDSRGAYNSEDPAWSQKVIKAIDSVGHRLPRYRERRGL